MTTEEAIKILDPETRRETLKMIPVHERISVDQEACRHAVAALRAQQELESNLIVLESNPPLTLDELRQMDGEPVWVEFGECGDWRIPDFIDIGAYRGFIRFTDRSSEFLADYGKDWLAYRHKPEPHTGTCTATGQECSMCQPGACGSRKEAGCGTD